MFVNGQIGQVIFDVLRIHVLRLLPVVTDKLLDVKQVGLLRVDAQAPHTHGRTALTEEVLHTGVFSVFVTHVAYYTESFSIITSCAAARGLTSTRIEDT